MPRKEGNVLTWATDIDGSTMAQAQRSASLPFIEGHVALMPDAHFGYGATVGSVIPTKNAIIPSAIGVDIGCGMIAARLDLTAEDLPDDLNPLHSRISQAIPAGVGKGHDIGSGPAGHVLNFPEWPSNTGAWGNDWQRKALMQFGSLGGGNHFVEVCLDELDRVWLVLHSGSRGVGNKIANMHIDSAKGDMQRMFITLPDPDLAYFVAGTTEFENYIEDMLWAQDYALGNREKMLKGVLVEVAAFLGRWPIGPVEKINCHHNFTEMEHHHGANLWITRKGGIRARVGDRGVIPGSMGAASYIVTGKGNPSSYNSCSHGAGRRMSRGEAKRTLDQDGLTKAMEGIAWNQDAEALLDEDPRSYKDIDKVMADQEDLVTIQHKLHQVLNYKGTK